MLRALRRSGKPLARQLHDWLNRLLPALAQQIAAAQGIAVNNGELLGLAAACHQRLHRRLARQLLRAEQAACPV